MLAKLNITFEGSGAPAVSIKSRGILADSCDDLKRRAFPSLKQGMTCEKMVEVVTKDVPKANVSLFVTAGTYLSHYLTPEGAELISEYYGVKSDYLHFISPESYNEFLRRRQDEVPGGEYARPHGGMSAIITVLFKLVKDQGGLVYTGNKVLSINQKGDNFTLRTINQTVSANKVIIATPPASLAKIEGNVTDTVTQHPIFKSIVSVPAFKGAAVYKKAWWNDTLQYPQQFTSYSECLGITMPYK